MPPAWTEVWMTDDPKNCIQAVGRDSKGRKVYLYSAEYMGTAAAAKFARLKAFAKAYPSLIKTLRRDMKLKEEALVLYLISKTGFRIGSNAETLAKVKAFGASTLRCRHLAVTGTTLSFDFTAKKGVRVTKVIRDAFLARKVASRCATGVGASIFDTDDDKIRAYLCSIPGGSQFSVKDFRTYLGTLTAYRKIKTMPIPRNQTEYKRYRKEVGQSVARQLGNSTVIALKSYVSPEVFCHWDSRQDVSAEKAGVKTSSLTEGFLECIHYDRDVAMEEFLDADPLERLE